MEILHAFLHFASMVLWYIFKGLLALIVVIVVGINLVGILAVIFGPLFDSWNRVTRHKAPINPYLTTSDELHLPKSLDT
jgi:hypothetical protein